MKDLLNKNKKKRPRAEEALNNMCFLDLRPRDDMTKSMNMHPSEVKNSLQHSVEFVLSTSDIGQHVIKPVSNLLKP